MELRTTFHSLTMTMIATNSKSSAYTLPWRPPLRRPLMQALFQTIPQTPTHPQFHRKTRTRCLTHHRCSHYPTYLTSNALSPSYSTTLLFFTSHTLQAPPPSLLAYPAAI